VKHILFVFLSLAVSVSFADPVFRVSGNQAVYGEVSAWISNCSSDKPRLNCFYWKSETFSLGQIDKPETAAILKAIDSGVFRNVQIDQCSGTVCTLKVNLRQYTEELGSSAARREHRQDIIGDNVAAMANLQSALAFGANNSEPCDKVCIDSITSKYGKRFRVEKTSQSKPVQVQTEACEMTYTKDRIHLSVDQKNLKAETKSSNFLGWGGEKNSNCRVTVKPASVQLTLTDPTLWIYKSGGRESHDRQYVFTHKNDSKQTLTIYCGPGSNKYPMSSKRTDPHLEKMGIKLKCQTKALEIERADLPKTAPPVGPKNPQ